MIVLGHEALTADGPSGHGVRGVRGGGAPVEGDVEEAHRGMDRFLPRSGATPSRSSSGRRSSWPVSSRLRRATPTRGADLAAEFCVLTETTHACRHMELADTVRLLLADGRLEEARAAVDDGDPDGPQPRRSPRP